MSARCCLYLFLCVCLASLLTQYFLSKRGYVAWNNTDIHRNRDSACTAPSESEMPAAAKVRAIFEASREFIGKVERIGEMLRGQSRNTSRWSCNSRRRVVNVLKAGYFSDASRLRNVHTVKFETEKCQLAPYLAQRYYDYSSNDCSGLLRAAHPGSDRVTAAKCKDDVEETLEGRPLQDKDISIGLPRSTPIERRGVIWAYVHVIRDAVVDEKGNIDTEDGRIEPYQCYRSWQPRCDDVEVQRTTSFREVFTIKSHWSTYYHTTIDQFARLALYRHFLAANPQIVLHYSAPHPFQDFLGLAGRRGVNGTVRADILYAPGATPCGRSVLFQTQLFSAVLRSNVAAPGTRRKTVVLVRRSAKRFFKHHDSILMMVRQWSTNAGLDVVVFPDDPVPSPEQTRATFRNAVIVVAPHGAGEANIVLCDPGTVLIEGLCKDARKMLSLCYQFLARVLGMHYHAVVPRTQCMDIRASDIEKPFLKFLNLYLEGRLRRE